MAKSSNLRNGKPRQKSGSHISSFEQARLNRRALVRARIKELSGLEPGSMTPDDYEDWFEKARAALIAEGLMKEHHLV